MLELAFSVALAVALALALTIFVTAIRVSRIRLQRMEARPVDLTRVPPGDRAVLEIGRRWLMPRGFRYVGSSRLRPMIETKGAMFRYCDVYLHEGLGVFAVVSLREQPQPGDVAAIEFQSVLADGTLLATFNRYRHAILWESPRWSIDDSYAPDMEAVLQHHVRRLKAAGSAPIVDAEVRERVTREHAEGYVDDLVAHGKAARHGNEIRVRLGTAIGYVARLMRGNWRAAAVRPVALDAGGAADAGTTGLEADMQAYKARRALQGAMSNSGKWRLGMISALAFIALGAVIWDWLFAVYVLLVIAFHEGGHYAAMKAVGYRNLHVFFVPGLGGLATGEKQDATPAQKVFVYLAGPVPGIALATAGLLLVPADAGEVHTLLYIMLVINVINLLPVTPLDGGRVLEVILFARWPTLRFAFAAGSCLALLAVGALLGETVMFILGIFVAMTLPAQWRFSRLALKVDRPAGHGLDEASATKRVFAALARAPFTRWSFQKRTTAADELIAELRTAIPGPAAMAAGLAIYAACFVAPAAGAWMASPGLRETVSMLLELREMVAEADDQKEGRAAARIARDWPVELGQAMSGPADKYLALLMEAMENGYAPPGSEGDYRARFVEVRRVADTLPRGNPVRGHALLTASQADGEDDRDKRREKLRALSEEFRDAADDAATVKARIGAALAHTLESSPERLALLVAGRDVLRGRVPAGDLSLGDTWSALARERAQQGDFAAAEGEWRDLIAWHAGAAQGDRAAEHGLHGAQHGYMMFLVDRGRWDEAEAVARPAVEAAMAQAAQGKRRALMTQSPKLQTLFWIAIHRSDAAQARRWLEAWEKGAGTAFSRHNPQMGLARLAAADVAGDTGAAQEARKNLVALAATPIICKAWTADLDGDKLALARKGVIERHGICKSA